MREFADRALKAWIEQLNTSSALDAHWPRVILTLGSYYDVAVSELLSREQVGRSKALIPGLEPWRSDRALADWRLDTEPVRLHARVLTSRYLVLLQASYWLRMLGTARGHSTVFESLAVTAIRDLHEYSRDPPKELAVLTDRLLSGRLAFLDHLYEELASQTTPPKQLGPYSMLRLEELTALARRDDAVVQRIGVRRVDAAFEQQLAVLMQTLGFFVVPAKLAERRVDLLAIWPDPVDAFTMLIDAKSSKRPYALPTDDERALREYIGASRRLVTLPPLRAVLVVSAAPARTLAAKLQRLETIAHVPVRFASAALLVALREVLPGPPPIDAFLAQILRGPTVLAESLPVNVAEVYHSRHLAHANLVRAMSESMLATRNEAV